MTASNLLAGLDHLSPLLLTWLLAYAVQSTLLIGIVWLVCKRTNLRSNALKDLLWKAAVTGGIFTATLSVVSGGGSLTARIDLSSPNLLYSTGTLPEPYAPGNTPGASSNPSAGSSPAIASSKLPDTSPDSGRAITDQKTEPAPSSNALDGSNEPGNEGGSSTNSLPPGAPGVVPLVLSRWSDLLVVLWLLSVTIAGVRAAISARRLKGYLGERRTVSAGPLVERLDTLCRSAGIGRRIKISCSRSLSSPISLGNATICLPERVVTDLSHEQQKCILAHELAHLIRRDPTWLMALSILEVPFVFQPLNRLARLRIQELAEYICDDWAVRQTGSVLSFAQCLVEVATWVDGSRQPASVSGMAGSPSPYRSSSESPLLQRVRRLVETKLSVCEEKVQPRWMFAAIVVPLLVGYMAPAISIRPQAAGPVPQTQLAGFAPRAPGNPSAVYSTGTRGDPSEGSKSHGRYIDVKSEGEIVFTADLKDVKSVSQSGLFTIEENDGTETRKLEIAPLDDGTLKRMYYVNSRTEPYDAAVQTWLERTLSQFVLATGPASSPFPDLSSSSALPGPNQPAHATSAAVIMDLHGPAGDSHIEARARGNLTFTDDLSGVKAIAGGGSLVIEEQRGSATRKLQALPGANGKVAFSFSIDGQPQPYNKAAQAWLAEILPDLAPRLLCHTTQPVVYLSNAQ